MVLPKTLNLALRNLTLHKLRALLTVLGLVFGVSSVVAMLAVTEGASADAQRQIAELGANNLIIRSMKPLDDLNSNSGEGSFVFSYGLTYADFERISSTIPTVVNAIPMREFTQEVRHIDHAVDSRVVGVNPDYRTVVKLDLSAGRFVTEIDGESRANHVVLGAAIAEKLFPFSEPIGSTVRIGDNSFFTVIGVLADKASSAGTGSSMAAQDFNKAVYIPLTTDRARFGETIVRRKQGSTSAERCELTQVTVEVDKTANVKRTAAVLDSLLTQFHQRRDFEIAIPLELLEKAEATKRIFNVVLGSIASISLLVGGIGIMNIMLATVTERTREIGIRRALGARQNDITLQFLIETAVLSATGGMLGVMLGIILPPILSKMSGISVLIQPWSPVLAFAIAVGVGVLFGVYPARRAATMDPIEALRYE